MEKIAGLAACRSWFKLILQARPFIRSIQFYIPILSHPEHLWLWNITRLRSSCHWLLPAHARPPICFSPPSHSRRPSSPA
ncbi:hypothetical protein FJTKL_14490 [Diaporthe vaccinii]|uniref:Uncharacterized protein n=1 Tax=Diaporthe vaccinii TaxID=105482 RepID=A0ABR4E7H9_9PEZI